jgi:hypothetical protein
VEANLFSIKENMMNEEIIMSNTIKRIINDEIKSLQIELKIDRQGLRVILSKRGLEVISSSGIPLHAIKNRIECLGEIE